MKLNLGCGNKILNGYINLDKRQWGSVDVVRDVLRGLPFDDNKFDEVYASHFMEHIPAGEDLYFVISEVWRVLKDGGKFIIRVPHSDTQEAFYPDHLSYWNEKMVQALVADPYQSYGTYRFKIIEMQRQGIELKVVLEKEK